MEQLTLFDYEKPEIPPIFYSKYQRWKWINKYRKANENSCVRCATCKHSFANMPNCTGVGKYYKCELLGRSSSSATDIRLSYVCDLFEGV